MLSPVNSATPTTLAETLRQFAIELPDDQIEMMDRFRLQLWETNEKLNLTRHTTLEKFVSRDIVDSMALERFIESGDRVLDVGTGGGVPGVLLAIMRPDLEVTLCESMAKKAKAVAEIIAPLGLEIRVFHSRAETLLEEEAFDTLVARAVAPLVKLARWFGPYWGTINQLLMVKGRNWTEERHEAREAGLLRQVQLRRLYTYATPGTDMESVILRLSSGDRAD
jgi:16S rRNA (guanine527-N7)-methyltransferase